MPWSMHDDSYPVFINSKKANAAMVRQRDSLILISKNPLDTFCIGRALGESLTRGDCVALTGELGAGKTCLTQGIAAGLGVPDGYVVTSPTFTLINEYPGKKTSLYHFDVYRLSGSVDLEEMGYEEYLWATVWWSSSGRKRYPMSFLMMRCGRIDLSG